MGGPGRGPALSASAWALLCLLFGGVVLFGAVGSTPLPADLGRIDLYLYFLVAATLLGSALVWLTPRERRPSFWWVCLAAAFPLWVSLQLVPLPAGFREAISPESVLRLARSWPGELRGCGGDLLLAPGPPAWWPISLDPVSTIRFLLLPIAAAAVLLGMLSALRARAIRRRGLLAAIAIFGGAEALYGLMQWALGLGYALWRPVEHANACGTLINRNHFAMLLYVGLACSLALLGPGTRRSHTPSARANLRIAGLSALAGLQIAAVLASQSRGGTLGILVVLLAGLPSLLRQGRRHRAVSLALIALICIPALAALAPGLEERFSRIGEEWTSPTGRGAVYRQTMEIASGYPLAGIGAGSFALVFAGVRSPEIQVRWEHVHNDWLEALVETGVVGLLILVAVAAAILIAGVRGRFRARPRLPLVLIAGLLVVWVHALADFALQIPALALLAAALAGVVVVWPDVGRDRAVEGGRVEAAAAASLALAVGALALAVPAWSNPSFLPPVSAGPCVEVREIAGALAVRPLDSWISSRASWLLPPNPGSAPPVELASAARTLSDHVRRTDPWNAQKRSRILEVALDLGDAEAALEDFVALARTRPSLLVTRRRLFERLYGLGITRDRLAERLRPVTDVSKEALRQIVRDRCFREDYELVRALVAPEPEATPSACMASDAIRLALRRAYGNSSSFEPFLAACLALPEIRQSEEDSQRIITRLAGEYLRRQRPDEAKPLIDEIVKASTRAAYLRSWAWQTKNWTTLRDATWRLLEDLPAASRPRRRAALHWELAVAYAHLGDQPAARRHAQQAATLDPARANAVERITRLLRSLLEAP